MRQRWLLSLSTGIKSIMSNILLPVSQKHVFSGHNQTGKFGLFLGDKPALIDTVNCPYPQLMKLYTQLKSMDWPFNEFPFHICNAQFKAAPREEYQAMINTLGWQWEMDSVAARSIIAVAAPYISSSELSVLWTKISENENTHALSYSEAVKYSFDDPGEVKKAVLELKESQGRMNVVARIMEEAYVVGHMLALNQISRSEPRVYKAIFMFVVALLVMERGQFNPSFAVTFAYASVGKYVPIGSMVQKIQADEFQIHQRADKAILEIEMSTQRGRDFFENNKEEIRSVIEEVRSTELAWNEFNFKSIGVDQIAGCLYKYQLDRFVNWNIASINEFFGFEDKDAPDSNGLPNSVFRMFDMNNIQTSPQEQKFGNYLKAFVIDDRPASYDITEMLGKFH